MMPEDHVCTATELAAVPYVPEIMVRMPAEPFGLWEIWASTGREAPPFWAFPWAGGQGLARYVLDHPSVVAGKVVLDVASGSGLVAIAAARAGARRVIATDIDPSALAAIALNAATNDVAVEVRLLDLAAGGSAPDWAFADAEVVLAADIFYTRAVAPHALRFLQDARHAGADIVLADPGRAFLPREALTAVERHEVPVLRSIEDTDIKQVTVYRLRS
jgi:predicted nicotinamide N-methyase